MEITYVNQKKMYLIGAPQSRDLSDAGFVYDSCLVYIFLGLSCDMGYIFGLSCDSFGVK